MMTGMPFTLAWDSMFPLVLATTSVFPDLLGSGFSTLAGIRITISLPSIVTCISALFLSGAVIGLRLASCFSGSFHALSTLFTVYLACRSTHRALRIEESLFSSPYTAAAAMAIAVELSCYPSRSMPPLRRV